MTEIAFKTFQKKQFTEFIWLLSMKDAKKEAFQKNQTIRKDWTEDFSISHQIRFTIDAKP
jgi:hypothetical protein